MAKTITDVLKDDSPKMQAKITKYLEGDNVIGLTRQYFESFKNEVINGSSNHDFPKLKIIITDSFVAYYEYALSFKLNIVPLDMVKNVYRTNVVNGNYSFEDFFLAVEMTDGNKTLMSRTFRSGKKSLQIYDEIIATLKSKISLRGGQY